MAYSIAMHGSTPVVIADLDFVEEQDELKTRVINQEQLENTFRNEFDMLREDAREFAREVLESVARLRGGR
jgi:hypothetical protein